MRVAHRGLRRSVPALLACALALGSALAQHPADLQIPAGTRIHIQLNDHLSSKLNSEGDSFTAEVVAPVVVADRVVIPKGSIVSGTVSRVVRPGRFRGKAMINLLFDSIRVTGRGKASFSASLASLEPDGNSGVQSEGTVEGEGSKGRDAGQVGKPALAGAGVGALVSGGSGAAIGAGVGAVVGLASVLTTRGKDLELRRGIGLEIVLDKPLVLPTGDAEASGARNR